MFLSIWQRYILKEIGKTAFLFLFCFYLLYVLIDFAHHSSYFHQQNHFSWHRFCVYYLCEFSRQIELLLPIAMLLGSLRVLCKINQENELLAMLSSGITLKVLLRPVLFIGLQTTLLLYLNSEFTLPHALKELQYLDDAKLITKNQKNQAIQTLFLQDGSQLLFKKYDYSRAQFLDLYWIRSPNEIIKMASLNPTAIPMIGEEVFYLQRSPTGELSAVKREATALFPHLLLDNQQVQETIAQPEALAPSDLWSKLPNGPATSEKEAKLVATFYRKLLFPWIAFLIIAAAIPSCLSFSRQFSPFYIYAFALFGLIAGTIALDAAHILAKRQLLSPTSVLLLPTAGIALLSLTRYRRFTHTQ